MKVDLLFISDNKDIKIQEISTLLDNLEGVSLDKKEKILKFKNTSIQYSTKVAYSMNYINLSLKVEKNNRNNAHILSDIKDLIIKSKYRASYKIIVDYDESSMYMNEKLYSLISKNEWRIRRFILLILVNAFGIDWSKETLTDDQIKQLKKKIRNNGNDQMVDIQLIEKALEFFTYKEYIWFLFNKQIPEESPTNTPIQRKAYSLWERYFSYIQYDEIEENIEEIRKIRNDVMHNKQISFEYFGSAEQLLKHSNKKFNKAIEYTRKLQAGNSDMLIDVLLSIENYLSQISPTMDSIKSFEKNIKNTVPKIQITQNLPDFKNMKPFIDATTKQLEPIAKAAKALSPYKNENLKLLISKTADISKSYKNLAKTISSSMVTIKNLNNDNEKNTE